MGYLREETCYIFETANNIAEIDIDDIDVDDDTDDDDTIEDEIFEDENSTETVIENQTYYIGMPILGKDGNYLYSNHISVKNYFAYHPENVDKYLRDYSYVEVEDTQQIEIMKTHFGYEKIGGEDVYVAHVVLKTCWLRIFQNIWRNRNARKNGL
jgi:hypothetical protein